MFHIIIFRNHSRRVHSVVVKGKEDNSVNAHISQIVFLAISNKILKITSTHLPPTRTPTQLHSDWLSANASLFPLS